MAKLKFIDNPSNYEYVTNKLIRCRKATIIEDILKYQNKVPDTYLYIRSIEFVKGGGIINDEYEVHLELYKAKSYFLKPLTGFAVDKSVIHHFLFLSCTTSHPLRPTDLK